MKRILITGGAGFIGSHLVTSLLERGDQVLVIDNLATSKKQNVPKNINFVEGSIVDESLVNRCFTDFKPDLVVHCAASYKDPNAWEEDIKTNVLGTINIVRSSLEHKVNRLVYFQTALCYGLKPLETPVSINHPLRPEGSSYGYSKTVAEQYIELSGINYITFRLANIIGPRNFSGPVATFYNRLVCGKKCFVMDTRRDFVDVRDLIRLVLMALDGQGNKGAYHVSSGEDISIKRLFELTVKSMNITLNEKVEEKPRGPDDAPTLLLDPSKTLKDFGWKTEISYEQAIQDMVIWCQQNGVEETYTHLELKENKKN